MSSVDAVTTIREKLPDIVASDMEAAPIAQVANFYNIPVLNVRGVSDHVGGNAPDTFEETLEKHLKTHSKQCVLSLNISYKSP